MQSTTKIATPSWEKVKKRKCGQWNDSSSDSSENTQDIFGKQTFQLLRENSAKMTVVDLSYSLIDVFQ